MNHVSPVLVPLIESAIRNSIEQFAAQAEGNSLSDLFLYYNSETSDLTIYDDLEHVLTTLSLENVLEEMNDSIEKQLISSTKAVLHSLKDSELLQQEFVFKPFSVSWVDDSFIVLEELLFLDADMMKLDQLLMKDLDKELNDFLKDLLNTP